jgi:hypothetical protein
VRELPYSIADVELVEDVELQEALQGPAMNAVLQVRGSLLLLLMAGWLEEENGVTEAASAAYAAS